MTGQREGDAPFVILAGGRASRLNGDKALAPFAGATLLDAVLARCRAGSWRGPIAINANGDPGRFDRFGLPVLVDSIPEFPGPLAGILAAMDWAASSTTRQWVGTVPVDTPLLPAGLMGSLQAVLPGLAADTIICAESASGLHPVVALWPLCLRKSLRQAVVGEGIRRVRDFIARHRLHRVVFPDDGFDAFFNVNSAVELVAAEAVWRRIRPDSAAG